MSQQEGQNVWFGIAMLLVGLVIGILLTIVSGLSVGGLSGRKAPTPSAPTQQPQAPQANAQDMMLAVVSEIGLDEDTFTACTKDEDGALVQRINQIMADGQKAGVQGTPGNIIYSRKAKQGVLVAGARPLADFKKNIDEMMKNGKYAPTDGSATVTTSVTPIASSEFILGNEKADIVIIEYSDYECPFCHRVHPTLQQLMTDYDGKIAWVFRHYPLPPTMHPNAMPMAIGAECAAAQGGADAFWAYTDALMSQN
jgi:protein-disulfide isomerase